MLYSTALSHVHVPMKRFHHWTALCHQELRRKRRALNLGMEARALIICDAAAVHSCHLFERIRQRFESEANAILLTGGPHPTRPSVPGGWGATGAPNDAWHQFYHYLRRAWMRSCLGYSSSTTTRRALQDMDMAVDGNLRITFLCSITIRKDIHFSAVRIFLTITIL